MGTQLELIPTAGQVFIRPLQWETEIYSTAPVGEGHDPPGGRHPRFPTILGESAGSSVRIRRNMVRIVFAHCQEGHDPPLRVRHDKRKFTSMTEVPVFFQKGLAIGWECDIII